MKSFPHLNARSLVLNLVAVFLILICDNCNEKREIKNTQPPEAKKPPLRSFNINGLLSFTKNTTLKTTVEYFGKNNINYQMNPNVSTSVNTFSATFWPWDCPYTKYIYLPQWEALGLSFQNILFAFYNDTLSFINIGKTREYANEGSIAKLREYYKQKYGEADYDYSWPKVNNASPEYQWWKYNNWKDSVFVWFCRTNKAYDKYPPTEDFWDEYVIGFPVFHHQGRKCQDYGELRIDKAQRMKIEQEKRRLDSL